MSGESLYLPYSLGGFRRVPFNNLSGEEQKTVLERPDTPKVVGTDGQVYADWAFLAFKHGLIVHVVQIRNSNGEIVGSTIEQVTNPAVIVIPMKCPENDWEEPKFLNLSERRYYGYDLISYPFEKQIASPFFHDFMTFPQGHTRWRHEISTEKIPLSVAGQQAQNEVPRLEDLTAAAERELFEEAGLKGTGRRKTLKHVFRDESLSASQITISVAEISRDERQQRFGLDSDREEEFSSASWLTLTNMENLSENWDSMRAYTALGMLRSYRRKAYLDPRTRFNN